VKLVAVIVAPSIASLKLRVMFESAATAVVAEGVVALTVGAVTSVEPTGGGFPFPFELPSPPHPAAKAASRNAVEQSTGLASFRILFKYFSMFEGQMSQS
jgi:hypothetical protein